MQELNLTIEQAIMLIAILVPLNLFLWRHLGTYRIETPKPIERPTKLTNERYGAYIQAQGRYYN